VKSAKWPRMIFDPCRIYESPSFEMEQYIATFRIEYRAQT